MIPASRFLVESTDHDAWIAARLRGAPATDVAEAATPSGFALVLQRRLNPGWGEDNDFMAFGREQEPLMLAWAKSEHDLLPSRWLIAGENLRHLATPDALSLDHTAIGECKTTGDPWDGAETNPKKIPIKYRRQVQFQLHVTGAERCLFMWQLRIQDGAHFRPGWWEPRHVWVERDEEMISELVGVADRLIEAVEEANGVRS